jgi:hypothetical protein
MAANSIQHLRDYGHSLLGSRKLADMIVDEYIETHIGG